MTFDRISNITTIQDLDLRSMAADAISAVVIRLQDLFDESLAKAESLARGGAKASVERKCYRLLEELDTAKAALEERTSALEASSAAVKAAVKAVADEEAVSFAALEPEPEAPKAVPTVMVGDLEVSSDDESLMRAAGRGAEALLDHLESKMVMERQVAHDCEERLAKASAAMDAFMAGYRSLKPAIRRRKADKLAAISKELESASSAASAATTAFVIARETLEAFEEAGLRAIIEEERSSKRSEAISQVRADLNATTTAWRNARLLALQSETEAFYSRSPEESRKLYSEQRSATWRAGLMQAEWVRVSEQLRELGGSTKDEDFEEAEFASRLAEYEESFRNDVQNSISRLQHHLSADRNMRRWNKRSEQERVYSNRRDGTGSRTIEVQDYGFTVLV